MATEHSEKEAREDELTRLKLAQLDQELIACRNREERQRRLHCPVDQSCGVGFDLRRATRLNSLYVLNRSFFSSRTLFRPRLDLPQKLIPRQG